MSLVSWNSFRYPLRHKNVHWNCRHIILSWHQLTRNEKILHHFSIISLYISKKDNGEEFVYIQKTHSSHAIGQACFFFSVRVYFSLMNQFGKKCSQLPPWEPGFHVIGIFWNSTEVTNTIIPKDIPLIGVLRLEGGGECCRTSRCSIGFRSGYSDGHNMVNDLYYFKGSI